MRAQGSFSKERILPSRNHGNEYLIFLRVHRVFSKDPMNLGLGQKRYQSLQFLPGGAAGQNLLG